MRNPFLSLALPIAVAALTAGCAASSMYPLSPYAACEGGCARVSRGGSERGTAAPVLIQEGECSWYGPRFHGRRTSNGERFDQRALTAAHRSLPFGSLVEVTNLENGKKVQVRINDRGPFACGRVIDLSYAAAASIGIIRPGVARVALRLVDDERVTWPSSSYALQVASFPTKAAAERFLGGLTAAQKSSAVYYVKAPEPQARSFRVRFGPFADEQTAKQVAADLKRNHLPSSLVREQFQRDSVIADNGAARPATKSTSTVR